MIDFALGIAVRWRCPSCCGGDDHRLWVTAPAEVVIHPLGVSAKSAAIPYDQLPWLFSLPCRDVRPSVKPEHMTFHVGDDVLEDGFLRHDENAVKGTTVGIPM